jgi:prevent-host-death family protein
VTNINLKKHCFLDAQITASGNDDFLMCHPDQTEVITNRIITFIYYFHAIPRLFLGGELVLYHSNNHTDFKRNVKQFIEQIKATKSPLVLTVNGRAEIVIQDASSFQEMMQRLKTLETEVHKLKLEGLQRDIALGVEQLQNGQFREYDDESLPSLLQTIKERGQRKLNRDQG